MIRRTLLALVCVCTVVSGGTTLRAQALDPIRYTLRFPAPHTHYVEVEAAFPTGGRAEGAQPRAVLERDERVPQPFGQEDRAAVDRVDAHRATLPEGRRPDLHVDRDVEDLARHDPHDRGLVRNGRRSRGAPSRRGVVGHRRRPRQHREGQHDQHDDPVDIEHDLSTPHARLHFMLPDAQRFADAMSRLGIGDDAAVLEPPRGELDVITTDSLVEDVHFKRAWSSMTDVGRTALAVNVSDLAAMDFEYIVCDSPAGIETGALMAMHFADEALVVTNPEVSSVRDSDRILGMLGSKTYRAIQGHEPIKEHLLITRYNPSRVQEGQMLSLEDIQDILRIPLIGVIPESEDVLQASNQGVPAVLLEKSDVAEIRLKTPPKAAASREWDSRCPRQSSALARYHGSSFSADEAPKEAYPARQNSGTRRGEWRGSC